MQKEGICSFRVVLIPTSIVIACHVAELVKKDLCKIIACLDYFGLTYCIHDCHAVDTYSRKLVMSWCYVILSLLALPYAFCSKFMDSSGAMMNNLSSAFSLWVISTIPPITFSVNGLWPVHILWRKRIKLVLVLKHYAV